MDSLSEEKRSWNMSRIKGKDTAIEVLVRKYLFSKGFRFRKNDKRFPGKPDIVLPKYKTVVFVNGCFWHMHEGCPGGRLPKSNTDYWRKKLEKNVENDRVHRAQIEEMNWKALTVWECEIKKHFFETMENLIEQIKGNVDNS